MPKKPITVYAIETAKNIQDLDDKVNKAISTGWQPIGGVSVTTLPIKGGMEVTMFQSMTK